MKLLPDTKLAGGVLKISTPAVAGLSSQMVVSVFETAMVGRLENTMVVLAAMGLGVLASWAITSVFSSLATGTHVLVARRVGEGDSRGAGAVLNNSLLLSLILGIIFGSIGYWFSYAIIDFFSSDPAVPAAGTAFLQWRFIGLILLLFVVSYRAFFNGIGHTKVFMFSAIAINFSNIVLTYVLVFGAFGLPRLGLTGAGVSYALSNLIGCIFFVIATFLPSYRKTYRYYAHASFRWSAMDSIVRISTPVSLQNIMILLGFLVFVAITGLIGTVAQAASQIVTTALFMSFLPCFGFGMGAQTLVGQSLGSGNPGLARRLGFEAARLASYFTLVLGIVFLVVPDAVIGIITTNEQLTVVARPLLRIAGFAQIFYGSGIVIAHALQATGATTYVMIVEVLTHWIIFLPLSYLMGVTFRWGVIGAWLAMPVYIITYSGLMVMKYQRGDLTRIRV
jgi:MATE family multidrug resistance protein